MKYLLAGLTLILASGSAGSATFVPHRAVYDLALIRADDSAQLSSADGRMVIEFDGSRCEGWTVNFRMVNKFQPAEGSGRLVDTRTTAYETGDYLEYHYSQKDFTDNRLQGEEAAKVSRLSVAGIGKGEITEPDKKEFSLAEGTLFPMQHQIKLMELAAKGEPRDSSMVYDGSDGEKLYRVITLISAPKARGDTGTKAAGAEAAKLAALPSWRMTISYYSADGNEDTPSYQSSFDLFENGVATNLVFDYGNFALSGKLASLDLLPAPACAP